MTQPDRSRAERAESSAARASGYQVYLLRLWREPSGADGAGEGWRCSLEDPKTRHRRGFESVDDLVVYLQVVTSEKAHSLPRLGEA